MLGHKGDFIAHKGFEGLPISLGEPSLKRVFGDLGEDFIALVPCLRCSQAFGHEDLQNCGSGILVPSSAEATAEDSNLTHSTLGPVLLDDDNIVWACLETVQEEDVLVEAEVAEDRFHQCPEGPFVEVVASRNHLDLVHLIIRQENLHEGRPNAVDTHVGDLFLHMRDAGTPSGWLAACQLRTPGHC